jgi:N-acetylglutamate synthase-like GNAT family acetyltransferase
VVTTRQLPVEEWPRLAETVLCRVWDSLSPDHARVVVVEDDSGKIVGTCAVMTFVHVEGLGIDEHCQKQGWVWRRLMHGVGQIAEEIGVRAMVAAAANDEMSNYLARMGATPLDAQFFVLPMNKAFTQKES